MTKYSRQITMFLAFSLSSVQGANLLLNSGFESGGIRPASNQSLVGEWFTFNSTGASAVRTGQNPETGDFHMGFGVFGADASSGIFQDVDILGGEILNFSGAHFGFFETEVEVRLEYFNGDGLEIGRSENFKPDVPSAYRRFSYDFDVSEDARRVRAVYAIQNFDTRGNGYTSLDNVRLSVVPEPSSVTLLGIAFLSLVGRRNRNI